MYFGYVRVSTKEQKEDRQVAAIKEFAKSRSYELEDRNIIIDKASGRDFERTGYKLLKEHQLRAGDTLIIKELDRLGRNKQQIKEELLELQKMNVRVMILDLPTSLIESEEWIVEMINNLMIEVLSTFAEQERQKIRARQREGIAAAQDRGVTFGRKPINWDTITEEQRNTIRKLYPLWYKKEIRSIDFQEATGLKKNKFYEIIKYYGSKIDKDFEEARRIDVIYK